jgi:hypothetical protein
MPSRTAQRVLFGAFGSSSGGCPPRIESAAHSIVAFIGLRFNESESEDPALAAM